MRATAAAAVLLLAAISTDASVTAFITSTHGATKKNRAFRVTSSNPTPTPTLAATKRSDDGQPGKGDLYSDDELFDLLNLHLALNPEQQQEEQQLNEELNVATIPSIHDLVLEAIGEEESTSSETVEQPTTTTTDNQLRFDNLQTILREKKPFITAIATDVDGTLLSGGQVLHPITRDAVLKAINQCYNKSGNDNNNSNNNNKIKHFFPATGKSRQGAIGSLGDEIGPLLHKCPV
jgi:hypothetical protein